MAKFYNVWRQDKDRWAVALDPLCLDNKDGDPHNLSYAAARRVVEHKRATSHDVT